MSKKHRHRKNRLGRIVGTLVVLAIAGVGIGEYELHRNTPTSEPDTANSAVDNATGNTTDANSTGNNTTEANSTGNNTTTRVSENSTTPPQNNVSTGGANPNAPTYQSITFQSVKMDVPPTWTSKSISGGNWTGVQYTNPSNPNMYVKIVHSTCTGCVENQAQFLKGVIQPDPTAVLGKNATSVNVDKDGLTARYQLTPTNQESGGAGVVHVLLDAQKNIAGYVQAEVYAPSSSSQLANHMVNSFTWLPGAGY